MSSPCDHVDRCPLCGEANDCQMAAAGTCKDACWCMKAEIAPEALASVPAEAKGRACICAKCAGVKIVKQEGR